MCVIFYVAHSLATDSSTWTFQSFQTFNRFASFKSFRKQPDQAGIEDSEPLILNLSLSPAGISVIRGNYDVETLCSASTVFFTVGRFIMRSCHAVYALSSFMGNPPRTPQP